MSFQLSRPKNSRRVRQSSWRGDEFFCLAARPPGGQPLALSVLLDHLHGTRLQLRLCIKTPDTWFVVADLSVQREEGEGKIYDPLDASMDLNSLYSMLLLRDLLLPVDRTHQDNVAINCGPRDLHFPAVAAMGLNVPCDGEFLAPTYLREDKQPANDNKAAEWNYAPRVDDTHQRGDNPHSTAGRRTLSRLPSRPKKLGWNKRSWHCKRSALVVVMLPSGST